MKLIARVFPRKTSMSPTDKHAYFGLPPMFPKYDEVHISVTFTWDIKRGYYLKKQWGMVCDNVRIGGPALNDCGGNFESGMYLRKGVVITSRGCPNNCSFCFVPKREGKIRELPIIEGNNILDNNFLACPIEHVVAVFRMLKTQKGVIFSGGIEAKRVNDHFIRKLREISFKRLYLAYDREDQECHVAKASIKLREYFTREQIGCYVLIGYEKNNTQTIEGAKWRLKEAWDLGTMPFAMLYQPTEHRRYSKEWKQLQRMWTRPAIIKSMMK